MTIQAWNIVLNAVVAVLIVGYGVWLRSIVKRQLDALEAVIKIKDAEISALKADTAPAITKAYAEMREHADKMTADVLRLSEQLTKAVEDYKRLQQAMKETQERALADVSMKIGHWDALLRDQLALHFEVKQSKSEGTK
jgi:hypothetical protein